MELADDKPDTEIKAAVEETSMDTLTRALTPAESNPEGAKTGAAAESDTGAARAEANIDRTLLMFQNSHLFELD